MSHRVKVYGRPSIGDLIRQAANVDALASLRAGLAHALMRDQLVPQDRTIRDWREAIWNRLCELMDQAPSARDASYIYNASFRWFHDDDVRAHLYARMQRRVKTVPYQTAA